MAIWFRSPAPVRMVGSGVRFALEVNGVMVNATLESHEEVCEEYRRRKNAGRIQDVDTVRYFKKLSINDPWECYNAF